MFSRLFFSESLARELARAFRAVLRVQIFLGEGHSCLVGKAEQVSVGLDIFLNQLQLVRGGLRLIFPKGDSVADV